MRPARSSSGAPASRTWTLRAPARFSRSKIGARRVAVAVGGEDLALVRHRRRQRQRLAAGAGAEVEDLLAGLARRRAARRSGCPRPGPRTSPSGRPARPGRSGGARRPRSAAMRRPSGENGVVDGAEARERLQHLVPVGLQAVDAHVERRAERQRLALVDPVGRRRRARSCGAIHSGTSARTWSGASARSAAASRVASRRRSAARARAGRRRSMRGEPSAPMPQRRATVARTSARGVSSPMHPRARQRASAARRRRCCRWRRGRPSRRSGATAPQSFSASATGRWRVSMSVKHLDRRRAAACPPGSAWPAHAEARSRRRGPATSAEDDAARRCRRRSGAATLLVGDVDQRVDEPRRDEQPRTRTTKHGVAGR